MTSAGRFETGGPFLDALIPKRLFFGGMFFTLAPYSEAHNTIKQP